MTWLLVAAGGAAGAATRFWIGEAAGPRAAGAFPWTTFGINLCGSFLLGLVLALAPPDGGGVRMRALLGVGFCGGFTTFSTFSHDAVGLLQSRAYAAAAFYLLASCAGGLAAVVAGFELARRI